MVGQVKTKNRSFESVQQAMELYTEERHGRNENINK